MSKQKVKKIKLYSVCYFGRKGSVYSWPVGFKGRLLPRLKAFRVVKRLKSSDVDAIAYPVLVNV